MKTASKGERISPILALFCVLIIINIIINTIFMRFWLYDSQYRQLNPDHYNVRVITDEDYKQLANPENKTVTFSNGGGLTKGENWDDLKLKNYKPVNDASVYTLVTIRGTAAYIDRLYENITPLLIFCLIGLFWGLKRKRVQVADKVTE